MVSMVNVFTHVLFNLYRLTVFIDRVWKELTLNSTTDQSKYRVWDYPIKEQYTHILDIIESTGPVENSAEAFEKANKCSQFNVLI